MACRYFSGFFQHHPLLQQFDYYWRMEPDVHYYCDLDYDPFIFMQVITQEVLIRMCVCSAAITFETVAAAASLSPSLMAFCMHHSA